MRHRPFVTLCLTAALLASLAGCAQHRRRQLEAQAIDAYVLGQLLADQGRLDAALAQLARAIQRDPTLETAHAAMGDIYREQGSIDLAAYAYERACEANPYGFRSHYNLGVLRQMLAEAAPTLPEFQARIRQAVEVYLRALALKPADYDASLNLGVCYFRMGQLDKAEHYCRQAVALDPARPGGWVNLGAVLDERGELYPAVQAYKRALELETDQPTVLMNLANVYIKQGRFKAALSNYELAAAMDETSPAAQERLAFCHYHMRDYDAAVAAYGRALALDDRHADSRRGLGVVYMTQYLLDTTQAELRDKALAEWTASLEINPNQPDLAQLIAKYTPPPQVPKL